MLDQVGILSAHFKQLKGNIAKKLSEYTAEYITDQVSQSLSENNDIHLTLVKKHLV